MSVRTEAGEWERERERGGRPAGARRERKKRGGSRRGCHLNPPTPLPHSINTFLDSVDVGDYIVTGELEAYSCEAMERKGWG